MMKFSIITVSYNSSKYIEQTINSVINQTYENIEYIIVDGGSTDGSVDIIRKYSSSISKFICEPDKNMYDAINKGLKISSGDYISILNSDDYMVNKNTIYEIVKIIKNLKGDYSGIYGNLIKVDANGQLIRKRKGFQVNYKQLLYAKNLTFVGHATFIMSRKCIDIIGDYDYNSFNYACDYDYILRCFQKLKFKHYNVNIIYFRSHSESITSSGKLSEETEAVLYKHNYYSKNRLERFVYYYYLWGKFLFLNFFNLKNKVLISSK